MDAAGCPDRDTAALSSFEMISQFEARVRVVVGFALWASAALTALIFGCSLLPPGAWMMWSAAGIVVHRMGIESQ
jgi:hypothetical protein